MRVLVFGASGATGMHIVEQGLIRGDEITAFVRNPEGLEPSSRLHIVQGDVDDAAAVHAVMRGHHAVMVALSGAGIVNIIDAMREARVSRIVALSAAGAADMGEALAHQNFTGKLMMRTAASTVLRAVLADALALERALEESDLQYTIVRPARLSDGPRSGSYRVDEEALPHGSTTIARGDVAEFMLMQLDSDKYVRKAPYLGV